MHMKKQRLTADFTDHEDFKENHYHRDTAKNDDPFFSSNCRNSAPHPSYLVNGVKEALTMKYLLLIYGEEAQWANVSDKDRYETHPDYHYRYLVSCVNLPNAESIGQIALETIH
jgi:hypothetical protein